MSVCRRPRRPRRLRQRTNVYFLLSLSPSHFFYLFILDDKRGGLDSDKLIHAPPSHFGALRKQPVPLNSAARRGDGQAHYCSRNLPPTPSVTLPPVIYIFFSFPLYFNFFKVFFLPHPNLGPPFRLLAGVTTFMEASVPGQRSRISHTHTPTNLAVGDELTIIKGRRDITPVPNPPIGFPHPPLTHTEEEREGVLKRRLHYYATRHANGNYNFINARPLN